VFENGRERFLTREYGIAPRTDQMPFAMVAARFLLTRATYPKKIACYRHGLRNS
jgi:hypothetical protein